MKNLLDYIKLGIYYLIIILNLLLNKEKSSGAKSMINMAGLTFDRKILMLNVITNNP